MNTTNLKANKVEKFDYYHEKKGNYAVVAGGRQILACLPCGHYFRSDNRWVLDSADDAENICLTPSIYCEGTDNKDCWHGYLMHGEFKSI